MVPTTLGILVVIFTLIHLAPGDPALLMGGGAMEQSAGVDRGARAESFRRKHGLDRALAVQFFDYLGPFNLDADGHPWFTVPDPERRVEHVALAGGGVALEGAPLVLGEASEGVPALLSALVGAEAGELEGLSQALARATGHTPAVPAERLAALGSEALVRHWFGWYYASGGNRVRASGARPWGGLLCGDLRAEMQTGVPVAGELAKRLWVTVPLALLAALLSFGLAVPLGLYSVQHRGTRRDGCLSALLYGLFAIPTFWAGLMLVLLFGATGLDWLPVLGLHDADAADLGPLAYARDTLRHWVLPVVTLTYGSLAYLSRQMRAGLLEVAGADFLRTARAKGLPEDRVWLRHGLRNGALPMLTLLGSVIPVLVGGSIMVETVFDLPGMGLYAYRGLLSRDANVILATTLLVGVLTQLGILASDVAYRLVDPRIGARGAGGAEGAEGA